MWENETKLETAQPTPKTATGTQNPFLAHEQNSDNIMLVQAIICVAVLLFIIATRTIAMPLFNDIKQQYKGLINAGVDISKQGELVRFIDVMVENVRIQAAEILTKLEATQANSAVGGEITQGYKVSTARYFLSQPLNLPTVGNVSSSFGVRKSPFKNISEFHAGIDIAAPKGSFVMAALKGVVEKTGQDNIRGNYIIVRHTNNLQTIYQHLNEIYVKTGANILRGQIIAGVGDSGLVTGAHLHFEVLLDNISVNPEYSLRKNR